MPGEPLSPTDLHVDIRDPAAGSEAPVLLLHGWASTSAYWEPLIVELHDAGHPLWVVDLPGYHPGDALPPDFEWTLEGAAESVAAVASRSSSPVHVAGHSMGGNVALTLAAKHPELVASIALIGMVPAPPNANFKSMLETQLKQGFIDEATRTKCMIAWFGELSAEDEQLLGKSFDLPFRVLGKSGLAAMAGAEAAVVEQVRAPLLVIAGVGDQLRSFDQVHQFVAADPARKLVTVPDAGHSVHWEQPRACAAALREFWEESASPQRKMSDK